MKAVMLDAASLGKGLSLESIRSEVNHLDVFESTAPEEAKERMLGHECVICNKNIMSAGLLKACPELKVVCVTATGVNNVDLKAAEECGIRVLNVKDYAGPIVSQHAMGLILMLAHNFSYYTKASVDGTWSNGQEFCLFGSDISELEGKTLGVLGFGAIGRKLAEKAKAFGMDILLGALPGRTYQNYDVDFERVSLKHFLPRVDVLSIHCPLTSETENLIGSSELEMMKSTALLINTARGGIVNEIALASALRKGLIAGAALDVLSQEPPPLDHPLLCGEIPNLIITPHNSWAGQKARQTIIDKTAENIKEFRRAARS
ncbi:MAG: D-2-hydroxyacid dehydrogenase [Oligoflexales bacterium]|nr:D-2-hydroxyacid dehydrogenase [Oligoflexales bacterium]